MEVSETSYPILKALKPEVFGPFSEKVGKLFLDIKPEKLGKSLELGIEGFNSVPTEKLTSFTSDVKQPHKSRIPRRLHTHSFDESNKRTKTMSRLLNMKIFTNLFAF